jgi:hypothetical protein
MRGFLLSTTTNQANITTDKKLNHAVTISATVIPNGNVLFAPNKNSFTFSILKKIIVEL